MSCDTDNAGPLLAWRATDIQHELLKRMPNLHRCNGATPLPRALANLGGLC